MIVPSQPYHLCDLARTSGTYMWFTIPRQQGDTGEELPFKTAGVAREFVQKRYPGCRFILSVMKQFVGEAWNGPNIVAIAVCSSKGFRPGQRVEIYGFLIGGCVQPGTPIPDGHGAEDGCIAFDLNEWPLIIDNLPLAKN